jgi:uncharacterized oligopeptide transporter (OPT) family protein
MSSIRLFESGMRISCIVILFNWFPIAVSGLMAGLWHSSYKIIPLLQSIFVIDTKDYYVRQFSTYS